jgi:penicillin-binding protein 1A
MNEMLNAALISGTGRRAALPRHPAAGKTGTSQSFRDAWFVGYTTHLTTGVWIGNDDGSAMKRVVGGSLPADVWREVMLAGHEGLEPRPLAGTAVVGAPPTSHPLESIDDDFIARTLREGPTAVGDAGAPHGSDMMMLLGRRSGE